MLVQRIASSFASVVAGLSMAACASLGPEPKISFVKEEIDATKSVGNVFIASPFGASDPSGTLDKAVGSTAMASFGTRSVPGAAIGTLLSSAGAPDGLAEALVAPYVAKFSEALSSYDPKDPKTQPKAMPLPASEANGIKMPAKLDQHALKGILATLTSEVGAIKEVGAAASSGNTSGMAAALAKSPNLSALLVQATQSLLDASGADHMLLTQITGSEADYLGGKKVRMVTALVNLKTGKFRFFGEVEGVQSMGLPYALFVGSMSSNLFSAGAKDDPALASSDAPAEAPAIDKTSTKGDHKSEHNQEGV